MIAVLGTGELGSCSPQALYFLSKQQKLKNEIETTRLIAGPSWVSVSPVPGRRAGFQGDASSELCLLTHPRAPST